ncbi:BRCT domain-containing protein [Halomonas stenophila]|uniref:NAD-dependent DNA ligase n=1 Tax=Halomonas stenophila TaxID=795312 RepID=A0A7W5EX30_9GAMM|nr:BRCT domain-containing protein [Halomonas stenophila]MBB3231890.1 NAD-dependent DNA ligase [Halomonas stenophila]
MSRTTLTDAYGQPVNRRLALARNATRDANELCGLARGMLADGTLNQSEAEYLLRWLEEHPESLSVWPFDVLFQRLQEMLADRHLDAEEEAELMGLLLDYIGGGSLDGDTTASRQASTLPLCQPAPEVEFEGCNFVLTGKFITGTCRECEAELAARGAAPQQAPTRATHFLVIGNLGSSDWAQSNYGRKIQHAVELRDQGLPIHLVSEQHWAAWLYR